MAKRKKVAAGVGERFRRGDIVKIVWSKHLKGTKKKAPAEVGENAKAGDVVTIAAPVNDNSTGCVGEIADSGPPLKVAVRLLTYQPTQLKEELVLTWNELRALAKALDIPATGKRPELEAKIKKKLKRPGRVKSTAAAAPEVRRRAPVVKGLRARGASPQKVTVKKGDYAGMRGEVVEGGKPPVQVILEMGLGQHQFEKDNLDYD